MKGDRALMNSKPIIQVGIALVFLGIVAFTYQGGRDTDLTKAVDVELVQAGIDTKKTLPVSPVLGGLVLVGGIVLVFVGIKKSS
jgi:uncharacterized membrane protein